MVIARGAIGVSRRGILVPVSRKLLTKMLAGSAKGTLRINELSIRQIRVGVGYRLVPALAHARCVAPRRSQHARLHRAPAAFKLA